MTFWHRFRRSRAGLAGAALLGLVAGGALVGPALDAHSPVRKNVSAGTSPLGEPQPPSAEFPLGTDALGRCVAARLASGARRSLAIGLGATLIALVIGTAIGLLAGASGGATDGALMRLTDLVLAFPFLLLALALTAALRGTEAAAGSGPVLFVLGAAGWTGSARIVRGKALAVREREFVQAARAAGAGRLRLIVRHLLPNVAGTALVLASLSAAGMILAESALAYLGLGAPPPAPSWGRMLQEGQPYLRAAPWLIAAPGLALHATVVGFHLLGAGLRAALDPDETRA
ncbi:MAG TPA: ABC transporter permease [Polyangia bacterium]|nr:ABC transporter permease [Polyangia bacterium]